jgi:hypothetical protein
MSSTAAAEGAKGPAFATFWHGKLEPIAYGCLASFAQAGAGLRVYGYDAEVDLPRGVDWADARDICPDPTMLTRYRVAGKPSLATFADMFRYKMIAATGRCWVDADILCLKRPDVLSGPILFGCQSNPYGEFLVNNAVLKLPPAHPLLRALIEKADAAIDIEGSWGAIGPFLLTELVAQQQLEHCARDSFAFYPIEPDDFWKLLSPACRDAVEVATARSTFLHLWGEMFERAAYDKNICPPEGSFLYEMFARAGTLHRFQRIYKARELAALLAGIVLEGDFLDHK